MKGDLPLLRSHAPNAETIGRFSGYVATFRPGCVTRASLAELLPAERPEFGWRVLETESVGPYPYTEYVLRAELLCPANKKPEEGPAMSATKTVQLGDRVKDRVTGFEGIVVARSEYLHGCRRVGVQSEALHEGKPTEAQWFDEPQVEVKKAAVHSFGDGAAPSSASPARKPGGPQPTPPRTGHR